jgi:tetratricopeptide (TPR) repeat protein
MTDEVKHIQSRWAEVNYMPSNNDNQEEAKEKAFEQLSIMATQAALKKENQPEALVWEGIVYSSYAGAKGGLGALSLAKHAKASYEEAIRIDADALDGSAYTSLGVLYSKVPGWPVGFGSDKKALQFLEKGLAKNPDGIDANYFYAEFMFEEEEDYRKAKQHLLKAMQAAPRPDRLNADEGRHQEITRLMAQVDAELTD